MAQQTSHRALLLDTTSRAFGSVEQYIQGPGELDNVFAYGSKYGDSFFFIIDEGVYEMITSRLEAIEDRCGCTYRCVSFYGECCREHVELLEQKARESGCAVVVGVGGGKVLDTVKQAADAADLARIIIPTSAASDAPAADWAAVYNLAGVHLESKPTRRSTELVLVDSAIIAKAPARLFAAGIGDAVVTWFEAMANQRAATPSYIGRGFTRCLAGMAIARECYEVLMREGREAYEAVKNKALTPAVEDVIEANILLSGLGFMNTGCAGAHGVHNGLSEIESTKAFLHGEKVAFGLICELVLENAPSEKLWEMVEFLDAVDLPVTLGQMGVECTEDNLTRIAEHAIYKNGLIHHEPAVINPETVKNAIRAADAYGRQYLGRKCRQDA